MSRKSRTAAELQSAAGHVTYEIAMLNSALHHLITGARIESLDKKRAASAELSRSDSLFFLNLLIEGVLTHARSITEFLWPRNRTGRGNAIIAKDFLPSWNNNPGTATIAGLSVSEFRARIDNHMSHLAYDRVRVPDQRWPTALGRDLLQHFERFYKSLPPDRRDWFGPEVSYFFS